MDFFWRPNAETTASAAKPHRHGQLVDPPAAVGASFRLNGVVKPADLDPHVTPGGLPEGLDPADVRPVRASGGEEDGAVADRQRLVLLALDLLVDDAPAPGPASTARGPAPELLRVEEGRHAAVLVIVGALYHK